MEFLGQQKKMEHTIDSVQGKIKMSEDVQLAAYRFVWEKKSVDFHQDCFHDVIEKVRMEHVQRGSALGGFPCKRI